MNADFFEVDNEKLNENTNDKPKVIIQDDDLFQPMPNKGKDGVYEAIVRFIPNPVDPNKSIVKKTIAWVRDPEDATGKRGRSIDCPKNIQQYDPIVTTFWDLWNTKLVEKKDLARRFFGHKDYYFSLVQIIEDDNNPQNVGKIMVWKYAQTIKKIIDEEREPKDKYTEKRKPFSPFEGRRFRVSVSLVSSNDGTKVPNFDDCKFVGDSFPMLIDNLPIDSKAAAKKPEVFWDTFKNDLIRLAPSLDKYGYQPMDEEATQYVYRVIRSVVSDRNMSESIIKRNIAASGILPEMSAPTSNPIGSESTANIKSNLPDLLVEEVELETSPIVSAPVEEFNFNFED